MKILRSLVACVSTIAATCLLATTLQAQTPRDVRIGLGSSSLISSSPTIAKELGLFEKNGINPALTTLESGNLATQALLSKSIDVAIIGPGDLILANGRGQKVVAIANIYEGLGATLVVAKSAAEKSQLTASSPLYDRIKALEGLVIATSTPTSPYTAAFKGYAQAHGINLNFTYMAATAMSSALESGAVQATISSAPFWVQSVLNGSAVVWVSGPKGELPDENTPRSTLMLGMLKDYAEANPEVVRDIRGVFADFGKAIAEQPESVRATVDKLFSTMDDETRDIVYNSETHRWKTKPLTVDDIEHEIVFMKQMGTAIPEVDPSELLFP